jgi:hypothetical protein
LRLFINGLSLDALGKVFGDGWLEGARCTTGVPLSVRYSLSMEQLFGGYP